MLSNQLAVSTVSMVWCLRVSVGETEGRRTVMTVKYNITVIPYNGMVFGAFLGETEGRSLQEDSDDSEVQ